MVEAPNPIPKELKNEILKVLPKNLVDKLVEYIHDSWWEEKIKQGFHHPSKVHEEWNPENPQIFCKKCHLDMIPFKELPENSKIFDKITIETTLVGLFLLGYDIHLDPKREKIDIEKWKRDHNIK